MDYSFMRDQIFGLFTSLALTLIASSASAQDKDVNLFLDGKPVLAFSLPSAPALKSTNGFLRITATNLTLYVWAVPTAKTAADALPRLGQIITNEFVELQVTNKADLVIANAPAKEVTGEGHEADDDDPGTADVVFFVVGGNVFAACVHGEEDDAPKARPAMMAVLKTAHLPPKSP
jgi:hypothetical protein